MDTIRRVLDGDQEAYGDLVGRYQAQVYRFCLAILGHAQDAEDAAQQTFVKAYRSLAGFRGESAFGTWLTRIAINQCKDRLRQGRRKPTLSLDALLEAGAELPAALRQAPPAADSEGPSEALLALLESLSPDERGLVALVEEDPDLGSRELGQRLGLSVDAVKGRLKRIRKKLRRLWGARRDA